MQSDKESEKEKLAQFFKDIESVNGSIVYDDQEKGLRHISEESDEDLGSNELNLMAFVYRSSPAIIAEIKLQNMRRKRRSFGFAMHSRVIHQGYHLDAEIQIERPDPILHRELSVQYGDPGVIMSVRSIGIPKIDDSIAEAMMEVLSDLESEVERVRNETHITLGKATIDNFMTAARRIFRITNTGHIMMITGAIYPLKIPQIEHLTNKFFRNRPPNDPKTN